MAKAKARKGPSVLRTKTEPKKVNPFELKKTRTKFDVVGRRLKGTTKNVVQARQDAHNKRKSTLLVEYKALRKANTFKDRRLGEAGGDLSVDEQALARMQAMRAKQAGSKRQKKGSKFVLSEGDGGEAGEGALGAGFTLTHGGRALSEMDDLRDAPPSLDELDDDMIADLVDTYNFGGGGGSGGGDGDGKPKTRKQVMEEIIAKSKMYKALKARQKEEDEREMDKLNDEFRELVQQHSLKALMKPVGYLKGVKVAAESAEDAAYDMAARALAAESRGAAGERTLTPEEMEERERVRLQRLEAERLRRMRGESGDDDLGIPSAPVGEPTGGYAARRKRLKDKRRDDDSGSEDSESEGEGESDDGDLEGSEGVSDGEGQDEDDDADMIAAANKLEARRREQAAGDHPLQDSFRDQTAALLAKYGIKASNPLVKPKDVSDSDEGDEGESEEGESEEEGVSSDEEGEGEAGSVDEGQEGESDEGLDSDSDSDAQAESDSGGSDSQPESDSDHDNNDDKNNTAAQAKTKPAAAAAADKGTEKKSRIIWLPDTAPAPAAPQRAAAAAATAQPAEATAAGAEEPIDLPYTIPMPHSYQEFAALVNGRPASHVALAVARIRAYNAPALAADSKKQLQVLYGMLVQHFAMLAGERPLPLATLDTLTQLLLQMTSEVPFYAATVARARLQRLHERLSTALQTPSDPDTPTWPGARAFLQLSLFTTLFPTSDKRHPVVTPLSLLTAKYLSQCTAVTVNEAAVGLLLCSLLLGIAESGGRYCPEPLNYLTDMLLSALPTHTPTPTTASQPTTTTTPANTTNSKQQLPNGHHKTAKDTSKHQQQPQANGVSSTKAAGHGAKRKGAGGGQGAGSAEVAGTGGGLPRVTRGLLSLDTCLAAGQTVKSIQPRPPSLVATLEATVASTSQAQQSAKDTQAQQAESVAGLLSVAMMTAGRAARSVLKVCPAAAPAALAPLLAALRALGGDGGAGQAVLPDVLDSRRRSLLTELESSCRAISHTRTRLVQSNRLAVKPVKEFIPRFEEEGFALGRDYDPDRERAEQRKFKRQMQKEKRGAVRELRRDAAFLAAHRDRERAMVDAERLENQKRFYAELQNLEADMKSGGQQGMNPHLKKKQKR